MAATTFQHSDLFSGPGGSCETGNRISLIAEHATQRTGVISTQVLQEFYSAAARKLGIPPIAAKKHRQDFQILDMVLLTPRMIEQGIDASILHNISFWGGLIITANATELLFEDLNHHQTIEGITGNAPKKIQPLLPTQPSSTGKPEPFSRSSAKGLQTPSPYSPANLN